MGDNTRERIVYVAIRCQFPASMGPVASAALVEGVVKRELVDDESGMFLEAAAATDVKDAAAVFGVAADVQGAHADMLRRAGAIRRAQIARGRLT